jgi:transglutaminase-like putative cysteine protease
VPTYHIQHTTHYTYEASVKDSANQLILYPLQDEWQQIVNYSLHINGQPKVAEFQDYFGNKVQTFTLTEPHDELKIISAFTVNTIAKSEPDTHSYSGNYKELVELRKKLDLLDFLKQESFESLHELRKHINEVIHTFDSPLAGVLHFNEYIYKHFSYIKGVTTVETTLDEIWKLKAGVCQDFAHMLLAIYREMGIPSRYVSGYICPDKNEMRGTGATHAWVEAYLPQYGWLGLDPTNNCIANEHHIRIAVGRNFTDCSPVKGTYRGKARHKLDVEVVVSFNSPIQSDVNLQIHPPVVKKQSIKQQNQSQQQ